MHPSPRVTRVALSAATSLIALAALVPTTGATATSAPAPASAAPASSTEIRPAALERGADPAVPHLRGTTVVDGDVRVDVPGREPLLYGAVADGYVVGYVVGEQRRVATVRDDAPPVVLVRGYGGDIVVDEDADLVALTQPGPRRSVVRLLVPTTGDVVARRVFGAWSRVLDLAHPGLALVAAPDAAWRWDAVRDRTRRVAGAGAYEGDLATDRLASFTRDPYDGGCTVVSTLSRPRTQLWRSCREAVAAFSPDGRRVLTVHKLTDGPGAGKVWERTVRGRRLAGYTVRDGYLTSIAWEDAAHALLTASGPRRAADVRCSDGACERVSPLRRSAS